MSDYAFAYNAVPHGSVSDEDALPHVPISRAELNGWYADQLLSLQEIAERASIRLGMPITRMKVREWLLALHIPRRSFSQAAKARAQKRRAAVSSSQSSLAERPRQLSLFLDSMPLTEER